MKKIMLVCSAGMSTSLLVTKMRTAALENNINVDVFAASEAEVKDHIDDVDVVLLGPQVRFLLSKMQKMIKPRGISVAVIDSINYGMMKGDAVLEQALSLMEDD